MVHISSFLDVVVVYDGADIMNVIVVVVVSLTVSTPNQIQNVALEPNLLISKLVTET